MSCFGWGGMGWGAANVSGSRGRPRVVWGDALARHGPWQVQATPQRPCHSATAPTPS